VTDVTDSTEYDRFPRRRAFRERCVLTRALCAWWRVYS